MRKTLVCCMSLALLMVAGCISGPRVSKYLQTDYDDSSLVFGYIDMEKAPTWMGYFKYERVLPRDERGTWNFRVDKGVFYNETFTNGSYRLTEFGGVARAGDIHGYIFPKQSSGFRVKKTGQLIFMGSFKFKTVGKGMRESWTMDAIEHPNEKEVLEKILPFTGETRWKKRIQKRLRELSK